MPHIKIMLVTERIREMPTEIPLKPYWLEDSESEKKIMDMLHCILCGVPARADGDGVPFKKSNGHWQLDPSNDWFAWIEEGSLVINYRYGKERQDALCGWLVKFFD